MVDLIEMYREFAEEVQGLSVEEVVEILKRERTIFINRLKLDLPTLPDSNPKDNHIDFSREERGKDLSPPTKQISWKKLFPRQYCPICGMKLTPFGECHRGHSFPR